VLVEVGDPVCDDVELVNDEVVFDKDKVFEDVELFGDDVELFDVVTDSRVDEETKLIGEAEDVDLEVLPAVVVDDFDDIFDEEMEEETMVTRQEQAELIRDGRFAHCEE
jgi:hypothetical protein